MISPVRNEPTTRVQDQPAAKPAQAATPSRPQAAPTDTVRLSSAAQEASETPAQTAKEAAGGDAQAKKLLAKESARRIK